MKCNFLKKKKSNFLAFCYNAFFSFFFKAKTVKKSKKIGYFMLFFKVYFVIFVFLKKESVLKPPITILLLS